MKFKVDSIETIIEIALELGFKEVKEKHQIDYYYAVNKVSEDGKRSYLRVRNDKLKNSWSIDLHKVISKLATEEIEVDTTEDIIKIVEYLGGKIQCILNKKRKLFAKDNVKICIDEVKDLGFFVELELEGEESEASVLEGLASKLKLDMDRRIHSKGYPDLLISSKKNP